MKKLLFFALVASVSCAFASDSYLYWMVDPLAELGEGVSAGTYTAKFRSLSGDWAWDGGSYLNILDSDGSTVTASGNYVGNDSKGDDNLTYFANLADQNGKTFYIELWNDSTLVAYSDGLTYSSASLGALSGMGTPGTLWAPSSFTAVPIPEPSSGLLMLIGCAVLGLRRKKQQKKA